MKRNKVKTLRFRCTVVEEEELKKQAEGFSNVSDYIRRKLFGTGVAVINPVEFLKELDAGRRAMGYIGNNINQIARHANQMGGVVSEEMIAEFTREMKAYNKLLDKSNNIYKRILAS